MSAIRENMKEHLNKRIKVRGCLVQFDYWYRGIRDTKRACIVCPENRDTGQVLADHVWVTDVPYWLEHKKRLGDMVDFTAIVHQYYDKQERHNNYCLTNADDLEFVKNPPALAIPNLEPIEDEMANEPEPQNDVLPEPVELPVSVSPFDAMRQAKAFAKQCGGYESALKLVSALETITMPLPELLQWIEELKD